MNTRYTRDSFFLVALAIIICLPLSSCEDFTNIAPPKTEVVSEVVFSSDASALSAVSGIYSLMMANSSFTNGGIELYTGASGDDLIGYATNDNEKQFYLNTLVPLNTTVQSVFWQEAYKYIFNANSAIEGLENSTGVSEKMKIQLIAESKFIRAFCLFYLTNLFGDIPLVTTSDYRINTKLARSSPSVVYQQIIQDLLAAQSQLTEDFSFTSGERLRPTRWAATALLARVYLYTGDWTNAEIQATSIINKTSLFTLLTDTKTVFLKNSLEAIWQLKPVDTNPIRVASLFVLTAAPTGKSSLTNNLVSSFEAGDKRRTDWVGSFTTGGTTYYFSSKYKNLTATWTEYNTVFRLAEQYLIRAEARAQLENISGSLADVNAIRTRAGLPNRVTGTKVDLLSYIEKENRNEFFNEWGHRWLDLKRTARASIILQPQKQNWNDADVLYPVPQTEINLDPNLLPQNNGY